VLIRQIVARSAIPVIASGGVMDADSAREKIKAGAQLLQIYTGLIYRGPGLLREIAAALS
jgi:dihydroorotate dehydrogenase